MHFYTIYVTKFCWKKKPQDIRKSTNTHGLEKNSNVKELKFINSRGRLILTLQIQNYHPSKMDPGFSQDAYFNMMTLDCVKEFPHYVTCWTEHIPTEISTVCASVWTIWWCVILHFKGRLAQKLSIISLLIVKCGDVTVIMTKCWVRASGYAQITLTERVNIFQTNLQSVTSSLYN